MLLTLDSILIESAQWIIRQIELFTPITRTQVGNCIILFNLIFIVHLILLFLVVTVLVGGFWTTLIALVSIIYLVAWYTATKTRIERSCTIQVNQLPKDIVSRFKLRTSFLANILFLNPILVCIYFFVFNYVSLKQNFIVFAIVTGIDITKLISEYFLCTTTLPLGEKERKRMESEMKNITPSPVGI